MPLVSVIFGPGKGTRFAVEAVESLIAQTYRNWELILAGDFAEALSRSFATGWSGRFPDRLIVLDAAEPGSGWAALRNRCACRARGKYLAFLDPDDVWLPERLSSQLALLESQPLAKVLYGLTECWYSWTGSDADLRRDFVPDAGLPSDMLYPPGRLTLSFQPLGPVTGPSLGDLLVSRELFEQIGGDEERFDGRQADQAFLVKACSLTYVYVSGECVTRRRIDPSAPVWRGGPGALTGITRPVFRKWVSEYLDRLNPASLNPTSLNPEDTEVRTAVERALKTQARALERHLGHRILRVAGANEASLMIVPDRPELIRVNIAKCEDERPWNTHCLFCANSGFPRLPLQ